jgi:hypothetical protein
MTLGKKLKKNAPLQQNDVMDPLFKKTIEKCMYYLNGVKRSNSLHTKWPPVRTMDMATRN